VIRSGIFNMAYLWADYSTTNGRKVGEEFLCHEHTSLGC
jgi:hypothetical protein